MGHPYLHTSGVSESKPELNPATQFRELYDQEYLSVYRSIRAVVLDSAAAEDLTQETFVRAYRARDRYTPTDRKSTRLNSSHTMTSRMPSSA